MNKDELKELAATLNGIADGKAWEFKGISENWNAGNLAVNNPQRLAADGWQIRLKPWQLPQLQPQQPDPYAELKAAHAAGKVIQYREWDGVWNDTINPSFQAAPQYYRIKPEQQKVPLGPDDIAPGSVLRLQRGHWKAILAVRNDGVMTEDHGLCYYDSLVTSIWEIKRPTDTEWQPCYKLIDTP